MSAVCYLPDDFLITSAGNNADQLLVWDAKTDFTGEVIKLMHNIKLGVPIQCIKKFKKFEDATIFLVGMATGDLLVWTTDGFRILLHEKPHTGAIFCIKHLKRSFKYKNCILTGSDDCSFKLLHVAFETG